MNNRSRAGTRVILAMAALAAPLLAPAPARAGIDTLKAACEQRDAADGDTRNGVAIPYLFCDDGVPSAGGTNPNQGAARALAVPARYDGHEGLPAKAPAEPGSGADSNGDVALDVDVSLPDPSRFPPTGRGYPLVIFMHGCCGGSKTGWEAERIDQAGQRWHYSNAWFAARGYAVMNYTSRGFVNGQNQGSTGQTWVQSRLYEVNDLQHLAGQLADDPFFGVDGSRVVVTGGSYGGGLSWLVMTDPTWRSPGGRDMGIAAVAPLYGWTDLVYSLVPNGAHARDALPAFDGSQTSAPLGTPKKTIVAGLYASGKTGIGANAPHATFPPEVDEAFLCLQSTDPFASNPACANTLARTLPSFIQDRSAYYQQGFFDRVAGGLRVPVFSAGAFSDPLFTMVEHRRMAERLRQAAGGRYPIQEYYGDYQHFVQNKTREWGDVCEDGDGRRICTLADQGGDPAAEPRARVRLGITTRLNRFVDHFAKPPGNPREPEPAYDVTASLQVCPQAVPDGIPRDEPGERFTEATFGALATETRTFEMSGARTTANDAEPNAHAAAAEPIANQQTNAGGACPLAPGDAGPGVATYTTAPLEEELTMIGSTRVTVPHTGSGTGIMLAARLYDVRPDGTALMADRGIRTGVEPNGTTTFDLHGNAWRFAKGSRIRIELAQDDDPYLRASNQPSTLTLSGVKLDVPVRGAGRGVAVSAPRIASSGSTSRFVRMLLGPASGEMTGIDHFEVEVRQSPRGRYRRVGGERGAGTYRFRGIFGRTYRIRARAVDSNGRAGDWTRATSVVPLDDWRATRGPRYRGRWSRPRIRGAYAKRVSRSTRRGSEMRLRFRGRRVYLIGRTGPRGGRALVQVDGRRRFVSFHSRRTRNRHVIATFTVSRGRAHTLIVRNLGRRSRGSRGTRVEIDGIGILDRIP